MSAERDLRELIAGLRPLRRAGRFVFTTLTDPRPDLEVVGLVREPEGTAVVLEQHIAEEQALPYGLFVPFDRADDAMAVLDDLARTAQMSVAVVANVTSRPARERATTARKGPG
jgi:hypothetical protein